MSKKTIEFKTEVNQILDLVINSLYSHKEIFLRELISNASDALDKLRFEAITDAKLETDSKEYKIKIDADNKKNTITISDNGIGMNYDDLVSNLGTIAKSGTKEFMEQIKKTKDSTELIGQFGVGFYASFMVAEKVTVVTKKAGEEKAYKWESEGKNEFSIDEYQTDDNGTKITLYLKKDEKEFSEPWKVRELIKQYSNFISYPIVMDETKEIDKKTVTQEEVINSQIAIWAKKPNEVKEEEYNEFYKHISHDFNKPLINIHKQIEGTSEYKYLIFIPNKAPFSIFNPEMEYGLTLYIKKVLIMNHCKELIPQYLRFVKGVADSSDLPLNVSREILQNNAYIPKMRTNIVKEILKTLADILTKNRDKYIEFYKSFGNVLKEGITSDFENQEKLTDLLLFESTSTKAGEYTTFKEYVNRMPADQKNIYIMTGQSREKIELSPQIEFYKNKNYEILFLTDSIDEWIIQQVREYDKKPLKDVLKGEFDLDKTDNKELENQFKPLIDYMGKVLSSDIKEVKLSSRLLESPSCLVSDEFSMSSNMRRVMEAMGQAVPENKRSLEINPKNSIIKKMLTLAKKKSPDKKLKDYTLLILDQALLAEGSDIKNPKFFIKKINELLSKNL